MDNAESVTLEAIHKGPWPYVRYVGTEAALRTAGIIGHDSVLPLKSPGCRDRDGEKISMLADGRLRVSLEAHISAARDAVLPRLLASAIRSAKG